MQCLPFHHDDKEHATPVPTGNPADYYYVSVPDKPGEGERILAALHDAGVNLIGVSAYILKQRRTL